MGLAAGIVGCCGAGTAALCAALREAGFALVEADAANACHAGAEAILLDGALPAAAKLCATSPLPVIEIVHGAPHDGADAYLAPPVVPAVAVAAVNAVIRRRRAARERCRAALEARGPVAEEHMIQIGTARRAFETVKFPVVDANGKVEGIAGIAFDIGKRKQAEEALRDREEHLRFALESASMGAWSYALSTQEFVVSPQASAMHGLPPGEPVTIDTVMAASHPEDRERLLAELRRLSAAGDQFKAEYRTVWPSGEVRWIAAQGRLMVNPETGSRRIFGVVQDVTERRRLEEQVLEKRKLEAVGRLAAGLAHRLNNSLTEVLGNIGFARDVLDKRSPAREPLDVAARACTGMAGLTRDLLAYAGRSMSFMGPVDLSRLVAAQSLAQLVSPPARLLLELQPDVPLVEGDGDQLRRLAGHLVNNAAEALGAGAPGTVTVAVMARELAAGDLEGFHRREDLRPGRYVCLRVTDSGCGMDAATLPLIFDPFFSTKFAGRGLGLASVLGVVRNHGGGIRVESEPGKGTSMTVCIPARAPKAKKALDS